MALFGERRNLKSKLLTVVLILVYGTLFAQRSEINNQGATDSEIVHIRQSNNLSYNITDGLNWMTIFEKAESHSYTKTVPVNFSIPKINNQTDFNLRKPVTRKEYMLSRNFPNPFNPDTRISYTIGAPGIVKMRIYNSAGMEISTIVNEFQSAGDYEVHFSSNAAESPGQTSGIYYYTIEVNNFAETKKMLLIK